MSIQIPVSAASTPIIDVVNRQYASYHPSIWGDHFLSYASHSMETSDKTQHTKMKEKIKLTLKEREHKLIQKLDLIDSIQRLGVSYHFESEIDVILRDMINDFHHEHSENGTTDDDLYTVSLKFRLLRQQGHKISCDVFNKFKDNQGKFKDSLTVDAKAMLSLYEASHLRCHGEDILDEALAFTTSHLESMATNLTSPLAAQISHALKQPIRKGLPRLEAKHYFSIYEQQCSRNDVVLTFAKIDFNMLQKLHQKEVADITKWWKELEFSKKLPFARDRVVECCFWILGVYFEPEYSLARRILTKVIAMTSVIDDIYDNFGIPEELELFTAAVERWDISAAEQLPEYMKVCYVALLDVYAEIEQHMANQGRSYRAYYAKVAMKNQVRAYFLESKWFHQKYVPTMEEYMPVALVSSGYPMLAATSFVGMGNIVTKDSFEWLLGKPKIVTASSIINRLMDDIVGHKFEQKRGHVASSIECYMNQHGASEQEAVNELGKQVINGWKDINEECLHPTAIPMALLMRVLNLARVMDVVYKDEDGYVNAGTVTKDFVSSLLIEPVAM